MHPVLQTTKAQGIPPEALRPTRIGEQERLVSGVGGAVLLLLGLRKGGLAGLLTALGGGALIARGTVGHFPFLALQNAAEKEVADKYGWSRAAAVARSVTVQRPREEVYRYWRDIENLPRFMHQIESVKANGDGRSHWVAKAPLGRKAEWDSETIEDVENTRISWKTVDGASYRQSGTVTFKDAPGNRGTEVTLMLAYEPPMGEIGRLFAEIFRKTPTEQARQDLRSFKQVMETGEKATPAANRQQQQQFEG